MRGFIFAVLLVLCSPVLAAEKSVDLDTSAWTQQEKNMLSSACYLMTFAAGNEHSPISADDGGAVVYQDPTIDVTAVLMQAAVEAKIDELIAAATVTPEQALSNEIDELQVSVDDFLTAYTKVLKAKLLAAGVTINISTMKADVIAQIKQDKGL